MSNLNPEQQKTVQQINRIDSLLADLARALEQTKADLGCADWATVAELGYIAGQLEQVRAFWRQDGPEYEPPTAYWSENLGQLVTVPED